MTLLLALKRNKMMGRREYLGFLKNLSEDYMNLVQYKLDYNESKRRKCVNASTQRYTG